MNYYLFITTCCFHIFATTVNPNTMAASLNCDVLYYFDPFFIIFYRLIHNQSFIIALLRLHKMRLN